VKCHVFLNNHSKHWTWPIWINTKSLLLLIDGFGSVIMHFRCNLGMSKTMLKLIANIKEFLNLLSINNPNIIYTICLLHPTREPDSCSCRPLKIHINTHFTQEQYLQWSLLPVPTVKYTTLFSTGSGSVRNN
jgi:hypothetical protein